MIWQTVLHADTIIWWQKKIIYQVIKRYGEHLSAYNEMKEDRKMDTVWFQLYKFWKIIIMETDLSISVCQRLERRRENGQIGKCLGHWK